jgi:hypothetical protein
MASETKALHYGQRVTAERFAMAAHAAVVSVLYYAIA